MPDRRQTSLKFPLEESVWFEKGQEVDELISISLDPHITLIDEEEFVILKGVLELNGEYKHSLESGAVVAVPETGKTYIQTVELRNEGESEFSHQFPVDITIPKKRIVNVNDLEIEIDSFDYDLFESCRLKLLADISVHGVYEEQDFMVDEDMDEEIETETQEHEEVDMEDLEERVDVEVISDIDQEDEEIVEVELLHQANEDSTDASNESVEEEFFEPFTVEARILPDEKEDKDIIAKESTTIPQLPEFDMNVLTQLTENIEQPEVRKNESSSMYSTHHSYHESSSIHSPHNSYITDVESSSVYESSSSHQEVKNKTKKKKDKYKSMSFADFFARKEEDASIKMRVCLVQQGDSIQGLADKYDISVQQILRANQLEASHEVYEGQVLYIPNKSVTQSVTQRRSHK